MPYVPPPPGATVPGQPTPAGVPKQDAHIADLPSEVRRSFLLSMIFFPTLVGATVCVIIVLAWWMMFEPRKPEQFAAELTCGDARRRHVAARELSERLADPRIYHPATLTALIQILENPELDKEAAAWTPTNIIQNKDEPGSRLRWWAALMVGRFAANLPDPADKKRGLDALVKALGEKDLAIFAARGLNLLKDPAARGPLVDRLQNDADPAVKAAAANTLGAIGAELLARQESGDKNVSADDLSAFRDPLRAAFQSSTDAEVRDNAAIALARLKDPIGRERLTELTRSEDAVIRDHARRALEILDGKAGEKKN